MPSNADSADQTREAQRQRIMDAARAVFARSGFHGASIQDIRAEAGMSAGNLYRYFPSKEAIIAAIAEADRLRIAGMFEELDRAEDPVEGMMALARRFLEEMQDPQGSAMCAETMSEALRNPEMRAMFWDNMKDVQAGLARALRRGVETGQVDPELDVGVAIRLLMALADGTMLHRALGPEMDRGTLMAQFERMVRRFIAPRSSIP
jgi:AcrR family transcriptional regulator